MGFAKVDPQADFPALEREVLQFWADRGIFQKRQELNIGKPTWSFLDGPITANNPMGVHHAWGRTYKDVFNRYFAMTGHELRYQNGFDCQGLWVEVEVEKELGLKSKRDIENLVPGDREASVAKFVNLCKARVDKFARVQTEQSVRLGMWMDWDRTDADWTKPVDERKSYFTMSNENNYTIWNFLKKCHAKGLIYRGYDAMPWCGRCGVGISEQEMKEGYKLIEHRAAFVKLPLRGRPNESLLVWTTTPWTLTSNVGAAINPELVYLKVQLKGETYYVSKGAFKLDRMAGGGGGEGEEAGEEAAAKKGKKAWLEGVPHLKSIEQMFKEKAGKDGFTIAGEVKGEELLGWEYDGPFDDLPAQQAESGYPAEVARVVRQRNWAPPKPAMACHRIVSGGKNVTDSEGTGIVHTAPGCGQIDFTWGKENGLPPVAPLDEGGNFLDGFGPLASKNAADPATAEAVFEQLKAKNLLFTTERYVHRYPHCWRCKSELLYRLVDEWFIGMGPRNTEEGFRGDIMKVVKQVTFLPESLNGRAREYDWLWNMGDWMISKKRFWGLALPIWVDEKDDTQFEVIGSHAELKERAVEGWQEFDGNSPHRPFVDKVKIRNPKTGNLMSRVEDVGNPWLDAGIVAFSTMEYNQDRDYWRKWYPADFITESFPGQFRNWFYALLALSTMMSDGEPPFKTLLGFATVTDQFGKAMHKSDGNAIEFNSAAGDENNGYELFFDTEPNKDAKAALDEAVKKKAMPDGYTAYRDTPVTLKDGAQVKRVYAKYKPISTDVIRWQYCRANPALNVKFGPEPADEVRSKFIFKLWNSYAFFCNCAAGDGFDPTKPAHQVPVSERPDLDRWILSSLCDLALTANTSLRGPLTASEVAHLKATSQPVPDSIKTYDVMTFALDAEQFVDEDLSNWYVRRVKPRLNSKVADLDAAGLKDKWAAYQTLHTVLTTLCRLLAPCIPFITEVMWKNLGGGTESVHLTDYPTPDEVDTRLIAEMDTLRDVITLGGAARNVAKINVRQPLAELTVRVLSDAEVATVKRFDQLIRDELNVKAVAVHPPTAAPLLSASAKFNAKTANAKLGAKRKDAEAELAKHDARELAKQLRAGPVEFAGVPLESADVVIEYTAAQPGYAGTADNRGREGVVSTTITEELKLEGLARNVVRQVNIARKDANMDIADNITLHLHTTAEPLVKAIAAHRDTIASESQATAWSDTVPDGGHRSETKIDGHPLVIAFKKV